MGQRIFTLTSYSTFYILTSITKIENEIPSISSRMGRSPSQANPMDAIVC